LLAASPDGIVITDPSQSIIVVNESFCSIFGRLRREILETSLLIWLDQLDGNATDKWIALEEQLRTKESCPDNEFSMTADGQVNYLSVNASLLDRIADEDTGVIVSIWRNITERKHAETEREKLIKELQKALDDVKVLSGLLPICSFCKKVRNDDGYWNQIEKYFSDYSELKFSHSVCQECAEEHYPGIDLNTE
jgi:PAS domain S-box-containing protein